MQNVTLNSLIKTNFSYFKYFNRSITGNKFILDIIRLYHVIKSDNSLQVALCIENNYNFCSALLACCVVHKNIILPSNHSYEALNFECQQALIITDKIELYNKNINLNLLYINFDYKSFKLNINHTLANSYLDETAINIICHTNFDLKLKLQLYTSGSTSLHKQINKTLEQFFIEAQITCDLFKDKINDSILVTSVYCYHMYGLSFSVFMPIIAPISTHIGMAHFCEELIGFNYTKISLISSPAFLKRLDTTLKANNINFILSAGGAIDDKCLNIIKNFSSIYPHEIYGSTETGAIAYRHKINNDIKFKLILGASLYTYNNNIYLKSPIISEDFLLEDKLSIFDDGFILIGRKDNIVKLEEKRINLSELEKHILKLDFISDLALFIYKKNNKDILCLIVCLKQEMSYIKLRQQLYWYITKSFDTVSMPRIIKIVKSIPLNHMGKKVKNDLIKLIEG